MPNHTDQEYAAAVMHIYSDHPTERRILKGYLPVANEKFPGIIAGDTIAVYLYNLKSERAYIGPLMERALNYAEIPLEPRASGRGLRISGNTPSIHTLYKTEKDMKYGATIRDLYGLAGGTGTPMMEKGILPKPSSGPGELKTIVSHLNRIRSMGSKLGTSVETALREAEIPLVTRRDKDGNPDGFTISPTAPLGAPKPILGIPAQNQPRNHNRVPPQPQPQARIQPRIQVDPPQPQFAAHTYSYGQEQQYHFPAGATQEAPAQPVSAAGELLPPGYQQSQAGPSRPDTSSYSQYLRQLANGQASPSHSKPGRRP
ncbi:hypothetical protein [Streptomyces sp. NPDC006645]|uniref:hypothetical protein n=1 Tax=unclassified Streptomyces TaxID=2593676 RepID=UPI0033BBF07F